MVQELRLCKYVNGINDMPFPNNESDDEQIVITSFTYNAQRMAATPTITATIEYPRCLDNDWDNSVYAEYNGEKYYIRQIPSSSKSNTSVMYKHDITLYSERFILENIYFTDIEKKTENGVDTLVKKEATSIIYRFDLIEYVERLNWSLEVSELPYRVYIDDSIKNSEKAKETKDIFLENAYLASAIQEIYNQWEIPFYFEGTNIIVKDCSENITDVTLAYGADESLLSIKKNNANFRKITRISGYGSDKNIPFYYPNWSQKGVIDVEPLSTNSKLTKSMLTITDMKKFDKKMPLNGEVVWKTDSELTPIYEGDGKEGQVTLKYKNSTTTSHDYIIPFECLRENGSVEIKFKAIIREIMYPTKQGVEYDIKLALGDLMTSPVVFNKSYIYPENADLTPKPLGASRDWQPIFLTETKDSYVLNSAYEQGGAIYIDRSIEYTLVSTTQIPKGKYNLCLTSFFSISDAVKNQKIIGTYKHYWSSGLGSTRKDYPASINEENNKINIQIINIDFQYSLGNDNEGWYLNDTKKINLDDIGVSVNGTPDTTWNGEGFTQEIVSKIPTAKNLMPSLYRNSIGERKFYNAINYPRSAGANDQDGESGETLNGLMYENENYKDNGEYYNFETLWTKVNQNEHIQEFSEIYPSITNVTNANNDPIDEILEVAFDENDNNEVDEEGKYIHPYFYVRIPQFSGNNGFNLFDHKIVGEGMQVAMTSGDCSACNFKIMVKTEESYGNETYEDVINPIKTDGNGNLVGKDWNEITNGDFSSFDATQQDSRNGSIWLVLEKDNETFNETYPNSIKNVVPKVGDKFVLLNIDMPRSYVLEAEEKLTKEVIKYMSQNNSDKWNFDIDFSRIFLQENVNFYERLDENCKLNVRYNGETYNFYVNNYKYEVKANEALPKITVGLVDTITINRGITQNIIDGVMKAFYQMFEVVDDPQETMKEGYLRKNISEKMPNNMSFEKDVNIDGELNASKVYTKEITSPLYGGDETIGVGFKLNEDENGESTLTVDNVKVRKRLQANEFVIKQIQFQGGVVIQSAAAMECSKVETYFAHIRCYFNTKNGTISNQFKINDLARCQRVGYAPKYYWRKVVGLGSDYIDLSIIQGLYEEGSDMPSEGDIIVQMGNTNDPNRQSAIEMSTVGDNSPSFIMYSGINSFSLVNKNVTGIVYNKETNEPQMYSYGSMFFGDRNLESNFITYQQKEGDDKKKLYINADVTFGSGSSGLSNLSEYQELKESITNISVSGGDNLASLVKAKKAGFSFSKYTHNGDDNFWVFTTPLIFAESNNGNKDIFGLTYEENTRYTISGLFQCLTNNDGEDGDALEIVYTDNTTEYIVLSYYNILKEFAHTSQENKTIRLIRNGWVNGGTQILKIKIEEGASASDWTPSMEDVEQGLKDYTDNTLGKNYAINNIIFDSYKQTVIDAVRVLKISEMKNDTDYVLSVESVYIDNYNTKPTQYTIGVCDNKQDILHEFTFDIASSTKYVVFNSGAYGSEAKGVFLYSGAGNTLTFNKIKLAEGDTYVGWSAISAEEYESIRLLNNAIEGSTDITNGLILTNLIEMKDQSGDITAGINGLQSDANDIRFWAGSSWSGANFAPFRVFEDGRVFGTRFYGFKSAIKIDSTNSANYKSNNAIDLTKTGDLIYLDRSLISGNSQYENELIVSPINLSFPTNIEDYIGSTVTIINPERIPVNVKCGNILDPEFITIKNCFSTSHGKNEYTGLNSGEYVTRVYTLRFGSYGDREGSLPLYTYNYIESGNGTCSIENKVGSGYRSKYAIQTYKLMVTPYICLSTDQNKTKLRFFGDTIQETYYNGGEHTTRIYQRAAFWVLESELTSLE